VNGGVPNKEFNKELYDISDQSPSTRDLRNILDQLASNSNSLGDCNYIQYIMFLLRAGADPNTKGQDGKTPLDYLNEELSGILDKLEQDINLLNNPGDIQHIMFLLQAGADPNTKGTQGEKTLSDYSSEKLRDILNELASNSNLLCERNYITNIYWLLEGGADPNVQNQAGKTLLYYLDEKLFNILNELASNSNLLNDSNSIQDIRFLLEIGANPNVQNQAGKTLLHYVAERDNIEGIKFLLEVGANPNVQDHSGRTPFKYATEHKCLQALKGLGYSSNDKTTCTKLSDPDPDKDQDYHSDGSCENEENPATPDGSVGESNDYSNSSGDDSQVKSVKLSDCNTEEDSDYHSDGSCENEENPANNSSNCPNKHNDDQTLRDDPGYGSGDDNRTISTEPSDCDRKDKDSSCNSSDYLFLEDSLLAKLEIPLTTDEQKLIDEFYEEIRGITAQNKQESEESILESIEKIVNEYLEKGLRLNSSCSNGNEKGDKETVTSLIFKEMEEVIAQLRVNPRSSTAMFNTHDHTDESDGDEYKTSDIIIKRITSNLLLKGGMGKKFLYGDTELTNKHYDSYYLNDLKKQYKDRKKELKSIACESIVNKSKQTHEYDFKAEIDNVYFYVKYSQDSIIEPMKILNDEKAKELKLKVGILQIGESIVRVEGTKGGKRNYTNILEGSIKMSFTTEVGEISIYLSPSKKDGNKIEVKIDEESEARLNKLKAEKESLGENCLLGGKNVLEAIEDKGFKKNGNVPTESIETIKDVPFTDFTQACSQQINTRAKGK
jgi:ankyrin repeat protein